MRRAPIRFAYEDMPIAPRPRPQRRANRMLIGIILAMLAAGVIAGLLPWNFLS